MSGKQTDIEELFKNAYKEYTIEPSAALQKKLRRQLWKADFFSVNPAKFNVLYTGILFGLIVSSAIYLSSNKRDLESSTEFKMASEEIKDSNHDKNTVSSPLAMNSLETVEVIPQVNESNYDFKAFFKVSVKEGCAPLTAEFYNSTINQKNLSWDFGINGEASKQINPSFTYHQAGVYQVKLLAYHADGRTASYNQTIIVHEKPIAAIDVDIEKSETSSKQVVFLNKSDKGNAYSWDFGDNSVSNEISPVHIYEDYKAYRVVLVASNEYGCSDTAGLINKFIEQNYTLSFPRNFRPDINNSGNNGYYESAGMGNSVFYPSNFGADSYELKIYTPNGMEVFATTNIKQGWNGYVRGRLAPEGIYTYKSKGFYPNGKEFSYEGQVKLIVQDYY